MTAAVTAVDGFVLRFVVAVPLSDEGHMVWVRMPNTVRTEPLQQAAIAAPFHGPAAHVMLARRVDRTHLTGALHTTVRVQHPIDGV